MKRGATGRRRRAGFSLVEVMTASFITMALTLGMVRFLVQQQAMHKAQRQMTEVRQSAGFAVDLIASDIRMAGYGLKIAEEQLADWVAWIPGFDRNPMLHDGAGGGPDGLTIVAAFDEPVAVLSQAATTGDTQVAVTMLNPTPGLLNTHDRGVLFLDKTETLRVTSVAGSGTNLVLGVSTHPSSTAGVHQFYPAGSPLELVKAVTYEWHAAEDSGFSDQPYITRRDRTDVYTGTGLWEVTASYIEDIQIHTADDGRTFEIAVTGIAPALDGRYVHPVHGDHYRRRTLHTIAAKRNGS